jgi:hypothetical protein
MADDDTDAADDPAAFDVMKLPVTQPGNVGDGLGSAVVRQRGIEPEPMATADPTPLKEIVQPAPVGDSLGSPVIRNLGNGAEQYGNDGVLYADRPAKDGTVYVDGVYYAGGLPLSAGPASPRQVKQDTPLNATDEPVPGRPVFAADEGAHDPRDKSTGPVTITPEQVAQARAAKKGGK